MTKQIDGEKIMNDLRDTIMYCENEINKLLKTQEICQQYLRLIESGKCDEKAA